MSRRRRRLIALIVVLVFILGIMTAAAINYRATKHFGFEVAVNTANAQTPPEFLYAFSGSATKRLVEPIGVLRANNVVYVADARQGLIFVFTPAGQLLSTFGQGHLQTPLYIAENPTTGNLYISDRRKRALFIFRPDGTYVGEFNPNLPKNQQPKENTAGRPWAPVAVTFGRDGSMYVTEILRGHRVLGFSPEGKFLWSTGDAGITTQAGQNPLFFQFPNSLKVYKNQLWVVDSNNRRVQVLNLKGTYQRLVPTDGLPRGLDLLPRKSGESATTPDNFVVMDTLSHDGTLINASGERVLVFGEQGVLDGQFLFPDDVSVDQSNSRIFISDTGNARVQVWGWPALAEPVPTPHNAIQWGYCLSPLLLLLLPLLFRRRRYFATHDFVETMFAADKIYTMPSRRRRWTVMPDDYEALKGLSQGDVNLGELLSAAEFSESDAHSLKERYELSDELAAKMATAQRAKYTCTEDPEVRRLAKVLELDVMNAEEFLARFGTTDKKNPPTGGGSGAPLESPTEELPASPQDSPQTTPEPPAGSGDSAPETGGSAGQ